nr:putative reverse transcriptase domain-containing protein [Tanacetum cinerariifolium]
MTQPKCGKCRTKAMMAAAKSLGVNSVELQGENKNQIVVIGDGVDAAALTSSVRKKVKNASLEIVQQLDFSEVFLDDLSGLPPLREIKFRIELIPGAVPIAKSSYRLAPYELEELSGQLKGLQYKELKKLTVKNRYSLSRIDDLFDQLQGSLFFLKIDLRSGYHQLRVHGDDILKTAFRTHYRHFEFTLMPYGPSTPPNYSSGSSRNVECSNCKHLRGKISVLKATMNMHMHPEQHTVNSAALLHEVLNEMKKLDLE